MGIGDQLTWAYRSVVIITLLWLRFAEPGLNSYHTKWFVLAIWAVILFLIFRPSKRADRQDETGQEA
jgi:hypothetical protein